MIELKVNRKACTVDVFPDTPLLWVLRETLGLTGTKFGCGMAQCGACTVHLDGEAIRSCVTPVVRASARRSRPSRAWATMCADPSRRPGSPRTFPSAATASRARSWPPPFFCGKIPVQPMKISTMHERKHLSLRNVFSNPESDSQGRQVGRRWRWKMSEMANLSRRRFLRSSALAGGGLVLGVYVPQLARAAGQATTEGATFKPNAFVRIGADDSVTVIANHSEMGQGIYTGLAMIVAEELDADWSKVRVEAAPVDAIYNHTVYGVQMTGRQHEHLDRVGAAPQGRGARAGDAHRRGGRRVGRRAGDLRRREPATWSMPPRARRLSYGKLAERAADLKPPKNVALKDPKDFSLIGKPTKRLDTPDKVNGKAVFGLDVQLPGMLVALVARPPVFGGKVKSFNADKAKAVPGVRHVVQIPRGIAVVADGFWPAKKGREASK